eukprot:1790701-Pyramimonas_sp.AAC.1
MMMPSTLVEAEPTENGHSPIASHSGGAMCSKGQPTRSHRYRGTALAQVGAEQSCPTQNCG